VEHAQDWREALALYYPRVRAWFTRVLADQTAVDDLAQEVFVRLCDRLTKGEVMLDPWSFIKVVAKNVFMEHLRARKKQMGLRPLDAEIVADKLPHPAEVCAQLEASKAIPQLLTHLTESDRYIVAGRYSLGMTVRELAEVMGTSVSTVVERHNRALCQLRRLALNLGISL
jgi:RNA polymerase sigma factor (sigma-70 family)